MLKMINLQKNKPSALGKLFYVTADVIRGNFIKHFSLERKDSLCFHRS